MSRRPARPWATATRSLPRPRTPSDLECCPHCHAPGLAWLTRVEWVEHCARYGVATVVPHGLVLVPGTQYPWWFCHACHQGGALQVAP